MAGTVGKEIRIGIGIDGTASVQRAFRTISAAGARMRGSLTSISGGVERDFARLGSVLSPLAGGLDGIAKGAAAITLGGATASAYGLHRAIQSAREEAIETARDINRMTARAKGLGIDAVKGITDSGAETFGALEYAFKSAAGLDDGDNLKDVISTLTEAVVNAAKGEKGDIDKLAAMGLNRPEIFYKKGTNELREIDEILTEMIQSTKKLTDAQLIAGSVGLFGDEDGGAMASFLRMQDGELQNLMRTYADLTGMREADAQSALDITRALGREEASWKGISIAIMRGYGPALQQNAGRRADFLVSIRDDMQKIAEVFAGFSAKVGGHLEEFASKVLTSLRGVAGDISQGPVPGALDALAAAIDWVLDRAAELIDYVATGKSDAPWIAELQRRLDQLRDAIGGVIRFFKDFFTAAKDAWAGVQPFLEAANRLLEKMGANTGWEKVGIIAGLLLFRSTIAGIVATTIPALIAAVGRVGTAMLTLEAAGAKAGAGVAARAGGAVAGLVKGAGVAAVAYGGSVSIDRALRDEQIAEKAAEYYRNAGQGAGAAFWLGVRKAQEITGQDFSWSTKAASAVGGVFGGATIADADRQALAEIGNATRDEIARGYADAMAMMGAQLAQPLEVQAGVVIDQVDISAAAQRAIGLQYADLEIRSVLNIDDVSEAISRAISGTVTSSVDVTTSVQRAESVANATGGNSPTGTPVNLYLDGKAMPTLYAPRGSDTQTLIRELGNAGRLRG